MCTTTNGLTFYDGCYCAGTGCCGGHLVLHPVALWTWASRITPLGWQPVARVAQDLNDRTATHGRQAPGGGPYLS